MDELQPDRKKKFLWIGVGLVIIGALVIIGPKLAASYFLKQGIAELNRNNYPLAQNLLERSLRFNARNPETHYYLGRIALGPRNPNVPPPGESNELYPSARPEEAITHFKHAVDFYREGYSEAIHSATLFDLASWFSVQGRIEEAERYYLEHIRRYPGDAFISRYNLAYTYFHYTGKAQQALDILEPALAESNQIPELIPDAYSLLGRLYLYFNRNDEAIQAALNALSANTNERKDLSYRARLSIAIALASQGYLEEAIKKFGIAETLAQTQDDRILNKCVLARIYFSVKKYGEVLVAAKQIADSSPEDINDRGSACVFVVAQAYLQRKDLENAEKYFDKYLQVATRLEKKNIFEWRSIAIASAVLQKLKQ